MLQESGPEHNSSIQCISTNPTNTDAITTAADGALLWDTEGLNKKRTLNGAQDVGVQQVFFVPSGEQVITCFKNDEIMAWDSTSMQLAYTSVASSPPLYAIYKQALLNRTPFHAYLHVQVKQRNGRLIFRRSRV